MAPCKTAGIARVDAKAFCGVIVRALGHQRTFSRRGGVHFLSDRYCAAIRAKSVAGALPPGRTDTRDRCPIRVRLCTYGTYDAFFAGEAAIAQNPYYAYRYALEVLRGPFPLGEPILARAPAYAFTYAFEVLRGPFPACEPHMIKDPSFSCRYAQAILKQPFAPAELTIYAHASAGAMYVSACHAWHNKGCELDPWTYLAFDLRWGEDCASRMDAHAQRTGLSKDWIALAKTLIGAEMSLEQVVQLCRGSLVSHQPTGASSAIDFTA